MSKQKRSNLYYINILFEKNKSNMIENTIYSGNIQYKGSNNRLDKIKITNKSINIQAERNKVVTKLSSILINDLDTIHIQIIKSLLFYYIHFGRFIVIESITIKGKEKGENGVLKDESYTIPDSTTDLQQVLNNNFYLKEEYQFNSSDILELFEVNKKSSVIFNALSYLLKSMATNEASEKFEKLWKSFNSIYKYIGNNQNEFNCQVELRNFLTIHNNKFNLITDKVTKLDNKILRSKLRLRDLILNNFDTKDKTVSFLSFIYRYSDYRISGLFKETLVYREKYLKEIDSINKVENKFNNINNTNIIHLYGNCKNKSNCIYNEVVKYLDRNIRIKNTSDIEIVSFLCI